MSTIIANYLMLSGQQIQICHGDLTEETTDAIVNAANEYLSHGGGVAGAILRKGGAIIQEESDRYIDTHGPVATGEVAVTSAGNLAARMLIHAVGPIWKDGHQNEDLLLQTAVTNCLATAHSYGLTSIALPAISSGIFGFPKDRCAEILLRVAHKFCSTYPNSLLRTIRFTNIDQPTVDAFCHAAGLVLKSQ